MKPLQYFNRAITSQGGEDGIILEIFKRIKTKNKFCIEFGTYDGYEYSNTWNLIINHNWRAVLIEPNSKNFKIVKKRYEKTKRVMCLNEYVYHEGKNKLDNLLKLTKAPKNFDLLSIDVDGNDYHIWNTLALYRPRVVIIENNPTMPPNIYFIGPPGNTDIGSSARAIVKLAEKKGYELIAHTGNNCIFIVKEEFNKLKVKPVKLEEIFDYDSVSYLMSTFDGRRFSSKLPRFGCKEKNFKGRIKRMLNPLYKILFKKNQTSLKDIINAIGNKNLKEQISMEAFFYKA